MWIKTNKDVLRKAFSLKVRAILLLGVGFFSCEAQSGLRIPFLNTTPTLDGDLKEWPLPPTASFSIAKQQVPLRNHADIWPGFDETNFYGAFSVQDTRLVQTEYGNGNLQLHHNDAVEIYVDTKNDSHAFMDINDIQLIMDAFGQVVVLRGDKYELKIARWRVPKDTMTDSFVLDYKAVRKGTVNNNEDTDLGYVLEFRIPWASSGYPAGRWLSI